MKREELTVRKEALYLSIRKAQHHSMIETKRRQLLSKTSSQPVQLLFKEVQSADNDKKVHLMLALIDTLGETDVFSGKTDEEIKQLSYEVCCWLLLELENAKSSQTAIMCLMGLANLMGDQAVNDSQLCEAVVIRIDKYFRGRYQQSFEETHEVQWIYSNILVKGTLHLSPQVIESALSVLCDFTLDNYSLMNQKLPRVILQTLNHILREDDRIYNLCRLNLLDVVDKTVHYLKVQDRERALEALKYLSFFVQKDSHLGNLHESKHIITSCIDLLRSVNSKLKEQSILLVTYLAQKDRNICQFVTTQYIQKLVTHLLFEDFHVKTVILWLMNALIKGGGTTIRERFMNAKLYIALRNILDPRYMQPSEIVLDILLKSHDATEEPHYNFLQYLVSIGFRQSIEKVYAKSEEMHSLADKCRTVLELMHNIR